MKKLLTILLILALSLSMLCFVSCDKDGGGSTPLTNAQKLEAAERKINLLKNTDEGEIIQEPFESDTI